MEFTVDDEDHFEQSQVCDICQKTLMDDRVRDHWHFTGIYRGAAHTACNLNYMLNAKSWKLPIIMHNLKGYDGHLIEKSLKAEFGRVAMITQNIEKYLPLTVGRLQFLDSYQFTPQSLDVLSKTLGDEEFVYLAAECPTSHFVLIRRNGVYSYDYMDSFSRFEETELPPQNAFFNKLSENSCSDLDYAHAIRISDAFSCQTMGDYHRLF